MSLFDQIIEFTNNLPAVEDMGALCDRARDTVLALGFDYFAILHHRDLEIPAKYAIRFGNYPPGFKALVEERRYYFDDPVLLVAQRTASGFLWSDLEKYIALTPRQQEIRAAGASENIGDGYTVPVHVPGEYAASCSFAVAGGKPVPTESIPALHYLSSFTFEAARRIARKEFAQDLRLAAEHPRLSDRQLDCIVLSAKGKSARDTAQLLGISPFTVQQHMDEAKRRFGVATSMQLVVRSLFDGQIAFGDVLN